MKNMQCPSSDIFYFIYLVVVPLCLFFFKITLKTYNSFDRHDTRRPLPSTRDTLRMLQKKREGGIAGQPRGMSKVQSGPLRADHSIQTMRKGEER